MKGNKIVLLAIVFAILARIAYSFPLDNTNLIGGTDTSAHLFKVWHITEKGYTQWSSYWYGGSEFLRVYPPLSYMIMGYLGGFIGFLLSYKLIIDIFFVLTPLAFYFFIKDFKLEKNAIVLALVIFSIFPIFFYYFSDGRHPTMVSLFFSILYWKFLKKSIDRKENKYTISAIVFLVLTALSHVLITGFIVIISLLWLVLYSFKKESIIQFLKIGFLSFLSVAWWWVPFILETYKTNIQIPSTTLVETRPYIFEIFQMLFSPQYYYPIFLVSVATIFSLIALLHMRKNKEFRIFFIILIFILGMIFLFRFKRTYIFLPIPLSVLLSLGILSLKNKLRIISILLVLIVLVLISFSIKKYIFSYPEIPDIPQDGRVLYLPYGSEFSENAGDKRNLYSSLLSPLNGNEIIFGYSEPTQALGEVGKNKILYLTKIGYQNNNFSSSTNQEEYYNLLRDGWINYVVINKHDIDPYSKGINEFFKDNKYFNLVSENDLFYVYELVKKSSYVGINGIDVQDLSIKKENDKISIDFYCKKGTIIIKESYNEKWRGLLDDNSIELGFNDAGFIQTKIDKEGSCNIRLYFSDPNYYSIFKLISITTLLLLIVFYSKDKSTYLNLMS